MFQLKFKGSFGVTEFLDRQSGLLVPPFAVVPHWVNLEQTARKTIIRINFTNNCVLDAAVFRQNDIFRTMVQCVSRDV